MFVYLVVRSHLVPGNIPGSIMDSKEVIRAASLDEKIAREECERLDKEVPEYERPKHFIRRYKLKA